MSYPSMSESESSPYATRGTAVAMTTDWLASEGEGFDSGDHVARALGGSEEGGTSEVTTDSSVGVGGVGSSEVVGPSVLVSASVGKERVLQLRKRWRKGERKRSSKMVDIGHREGIVPLVMLMVFGMHTQLATLYKMVAYATLVLQ